VNTPPPGVMPVLSGPVTSMLAQTALGGLRVALSDRHVVGGDALAAALGSAGVRIVTMEGGPEMVIETGPSFPDPAPAVTGIVSTTAATAERLRSGAVSFPVLACHDAGCVRLADRERGRRIVQAVARLTNTRIAGSVVTVTGYGITARAVAAAARSLGATVGVVESDPVAGLAARFDGHDLADHPSGVVMVVDGHPLPPLDDLPEGVIVVAPGWPAPEGGAEVRPGVWSIRSGALHVIVPVVERASDEADLVFSVAAIALVRLVSEPFGPGLAPVPADIDAAVARFALRELG
jgi:hypothetical protein